MLRVPVMHRRSPDRGLVGADLAARDRSERDRRVRRPERGGADRGNLGAQRGGEHRESVDVAGAALIGAHAEGGVALEVLDRGVAFAHRELDVGHRHVVLEVDEALAVAPRRQRHCPERPHRSAFAPLLHGRTGRLGPRVESRGAGGIGAGRDSVGEAFGEAEESARGPGRAFALRALSRHERGAGGVEAQPALRLREQVDGRVPAARDADQIARDAPGIVPHRRAIRRERTNLHPVDAGAADRAHHHTAGDELEPEALDDGERVVPRPAVARVDHRDDVRPGVQHRLQRLVGRVVVGEQHGAAAGPDPVLERVGPGGGGEHDAGQVVVLERERTLDGAGGEHHLTGPEPPHPMARAVRGGIGAWSARRSTATTMLSS